MRFEIGQVVYVLEKNEDQDLGWSEEMDATVGKAGKIINVNDDDASYHVRFVINGNTVSYHYIEDIIGTSEEMLHKVANPKIFWMQAPISGKIYKKISVDEDGWNVYQDKDGNTVTSEFFRLHAVSKECQSFDWVPAEQKR